jgi:hypothetical protein
MEAEQDVATIRTAPDGCCTYCHRRFGDAVRWHGRRRFLAEERDHVLPKALGGRVTVPCCSLCNRIKGSLLFDSLAEVQDYCLTRLLRDGSVTVEYARGLRVERSVRAEAVDAAELSEFLTLEVSETDLPQTETRPQIARRTRNLERSLETRHRLRLEPPSKIAGRQRARLPCQRCGGRHKCSCRKRRVL